MDEHGFYAFCDEIAEELDQALNLTENAWSSYTPGYKRNSLESGNDKIRAVIVKLRAVS